MTEQKTILLIGAGDFQLPLVQRAAERYQVALAAPAIGPAFQPYLTHQLLTDVRNKDEILRFAREHSVCGVITDQTDIPVRTVAYVAEQLGLPGIGYETSCLFTDKHLMREKMRELGIPQLPNQTVMTPDEAEAFYDSIGGGEVIIKPLDTQGSRGVFHCASAQEMREKFFYASCWSSGGEVIVERFAKGREFVVEGLAYDGRFRNLICGDTLYFDLPDAFAAKSRIFPTTADDALAARVCALNERIITGFGLRQGITHSEFIMDGYEVYLMETAARGGGVFISSDLIHLSTGLAVEDFLLDIAEGVCEGIPEILPQQCVCGYMACFVPVGTVRAVSGVEAVQKLPWVYRNQLDELVPGLTVKENTDKTSRIAMILKAGDRAELEARMAQVQSMLQVEVETERGIKGLIWS